MAFSLQSLGSQHCDKVAVSHTHRGDSTPVNVHVKPRNMYLEMFTVLVKFI